MPDGGSTGCDVPGSSPPIRPVRFAKPRLAYSAVSSIALGRLAPIAREVGIDGEQGVFDTTAGETRLVLRLTPGECSDGMSDRRYGYLAEVWIDGETLKGCASKTQDLAAQPKP